MVVWQKSGILECTFRNRYLRRYLFRNVHSRIFCPGVYQAPIAHQTSSYLARHNQGRKGTDGFHGLRAATAAHSERPCLNNSLSLGHLHKAIPDVNGILATDHTRVMRETLELCAEEGCPGPTSSGGSFSTPLRLQLLQSSNRSGRSLRRVFPAQFSRNA